MTQGEMTGGCQCGAVRYVVRGAASECNLCHCRMCQKASGGPFMVFITVGRDQVKWIAGRPSVYRSSSLASRGFCSACGTPLTYERGSERMSLSHGSLDDPGVIAPTERLGSETVLVWCEQVGALPIQSTAEWVAKSAPDGIVSYQHPDRP